MKLGVQKRQHVTTAGGRLGQWWTPPKLAAAVASWANVRNKSVIDLGAGRGALSAACVAAGAYSVQAVEIDERFREELEGVADIVRIMDVADILEHGGPIGDVVISNPIFENNGVALFAEVALRCAPRAVLIAPSDTLYTGARAERIWRNATCTREAVLCQRPPFGKASKNGMQNISVFELQRRLPATGLYDVTRREWWEGRWH